jgi:alcohol dehydrogenase (cytochrome c)
LGIRLLAGVAALSAAISCAAQGRPAASLSTTIDVRTEHLLARPVAENWPSYNGDYTGRRYSSLREITPSNVGQLRAEWAFHAANSNRLEVTPVVVDGVMFLTAANDAFALDARTGRTIWHY